MSTGDLIAMMLMCVALVLTNIRISWLRAEIAALSACLTKREQTR
jgi:hypothetical protein